MIIAVVSVLIALGSFAIPLLLLLIVEVRRGREIGRRLETSVESLCKSHVAIANAIPQGLFRNIESWLARPRRAMLRSDGAGGVQVDGLACISGEASISGGQTSEVVVSPSRTNWFVPTAMRMVVHSAGDPSVEQRAEVTSMEVNGVPQWDGSRVDSVPTEFFQTPAGLAVPVKGMSPISIDAYLHELRVAVVNPNPNPVRVTVHVFGEPRREDPRDLTGSINPERSFTDASKVLR